MKLTHIFTRRGSMALAAMLGLLAFAPADSQATIVVLKETATLDYALGVNNYGAGIAGGDFTGFSQFTGLASGDVQTTHVDDVRIINNTNAANLNLGERTVISNGPNVSTAALFKWDLSSLPGFAGSTVNSAVVRILLNGGNGNSVLGRVVTHDYAEGDGSAGSGATLGSPAGNTVVTDGITGEWGPGSDSIFKVADDTIPGTAPRIGSAPTGNVYETHNATADVQLFANGTLNYGWAIPVTNDSYISSENTSKIGGEPALFIDYTPDAIPEPTTMVLLGLAALCVPTVRRRK